MSDRPSKGGLAFVVQKHRATALHYDLRLEIGGTLVSWSIPKGPSLDPNVRRLAMPTSDHDMEYRRFEGVVRGARNKLGAVMIWDEGTYSPEREVGGGAREEVKLPEAANEVARESLREGNLKFRVYGKKLRGSFALVRTKGFGSNRVAWLMIKHRDAHCVDGYDANEFELSAASGRSLAEIEGQELNERL
jgi:bifunctional non-homologous end joining protein LigD